MSEKRRSGSQVGLTVATDEEVAVGYRIDLDLSNRVAVQRDRARRRSARRRRTDRKLRARTGGRYAGGGFETIVVSREAMYELLRDTHPKGGDLYTPVTPEMIEFLFGLKRLYGTWRTVCAVVDCKTRVLRYIRSGGIRTVSMTFWDKLLTATDNEHLLEDYLWFTPEDLMRLGLWKPPIQVVGKGKYVAWE